MNSVITAIQEALKQKQPLDETTSGYDRRPQFDQTGTVQTLQRFVEMLGKVGGEGHIMSGEEAALARLRELLQSLKGAALLPPDPELERLGVRSLLIETEHIVIQPAAENLETSALASLGITTAQAGIADTGTVVLIHDKNRGRLAALLAPVHVVFLKKAAVYPDKVTFLESCRNVGIDLAATPLTWVTGPSLTADIEKVLVRGAHGPRRVVVLLY